MTDLVEIMINVFLFVALFMVLIRPVKSAFSLDEFPSYVLAACVSGLGILGMNHFLGDSMRTILIPYAALGISVLLVVFLSFLGKHLKRRRPDYSNPKDSFEERPIQLE